MRSVTINNLSDRTHDVLKARALRNGRSTESEIRAILEAAAAEEGPVMIGSELARIGQRAGGFDLAVDRSRQAARPASFE